MKKARNFTVEETIQKNLLTKILLVANIKNEGTIEKKDPLLFKKKIPCFSVRKKQIARNNGEEFEKQKVEFSNIKYLKKRRYQQMH